MKLSELLAQAHRLLAEHGDLDVYADGCDCQGQAGRLILDPETGGGKASFLLQRYSNVYGAKCPGCAGGVYWEGDGDCFVCLDCGNRTLTLAELLP